MLAGPSSGRSRIGMTRPAEPLRLFDEAYDRRHPQTNRPEAGGGQSTDKSLERVAEAAKLVTKAHEQFVSAVIAARSMGFSWRRIGVAAGLPHQSLHRRLAGAGAHGRSSDLTGRSSSNTVIRP